MNNTSQQLYFLILGIFILTFVIERVFSFLNSSWRSKSIPKELSGIYDTENYLKQQEYSKISERFSLISASVSFIITLVFIVFYGFNVLNQWLFPFFSNPLFLGLVFFAMLIVLSDIIELPFEWYETFVIEEKFGFNKTTPLTFFTDKLKGYLLSSIIGAFFYILIFKLNEQFPSVFWLYVWGAIGIFLIIISLFYSHIIVPFFNKQKPLAEGELRNAIFDFANKVGFKVSDIYEIDGSKRSTRANAYFTGFGRYKRIVLFDTLIKELSTEEIVAVLAHEIGHNKHKHTLVGLVATLMQIGFMLWLLSIFINKQELSGALGSETHFFHLGLIAFALLYSPITMVTGVFMNYISRLNEYQADAFAAENYNPEHLISALKKLASHNLSNLTPHPVYVFVNYSHPDLLQRIKKINKHE